jgi:hypothetical protein
VLENFKNTKKRGDAGVGSAIAWFTLQGLTVSIPLTDSQDYDLVVDIEDRLCRVQVKTVTYKPDGKGNYCVNLRVMGGNSHCLTNKSFDKTRVEYVFVLTNDGDKYFIPSEVIDATTSFSLTNKYEEYKVS